MAEQQRHHAIDESGGDTINGSAAPRSVLSPEVSGAYMVHDSKGSENLILFIGMEI